ncbi:MAG: hypothetical protein CTY30_06450 [Methylocystis sp.]|nr:MAG: hypothetical protein CTY30_06450 [Methylocystis sp.]
MDWGSCDRAADGEVFGSVDVAAAGAGAGEAAGAIAIGASEGGASGFIVGAIARELFDVALFWAARARWLFAALSAKAAPPGCWRP